MTLTSDFNTLRKRGSVFFAVFELHKHISSLLFLWNL